MGGTFDPVHFGHLRLAQEAAEILGLELVRWVPAGQPWHRVAPLASAAHRLEMVRLVLPAGSGKQVEVLGDGPDAAPAVVGVLSELGVL